MKRRLFALGSRSLYSAQCRGVVEASLPFRLVREQSEPILGVHENCLQNQPIVRIVGFSMLHGTAKQSVWPECRSERTLIAQFVRDRASSAGIAVCEGDRSEAQAECGSRECLAGLRQQSKVVHSVVERLL